MAKAVFLGLFLALAIVVMALPRSVVYRGASSRARWRDLRLWALLLIAVHAYVYWRFDETAEPPPPREPPPVDGAADAGAR